MAVKNLIWPWSRIAQLETERDLALAQANLYRELDKNSSTELRRAKRIILEGHFRDPKTGRTGKKGVVPPALKAAARAAKA